MLFAYLCINLLLIYGFPTKSATRLSFLFNAYNEYGRRSKQAASNRELIEMYQGLTYITFLISSL